MKVSYPLSLKVSTWLLLNLFLLAVLGVAFFVVRGGVGWNALVEGQVGDRMISRGHAIAIELSSSSPETREAVLTRARQTYGAEFSLYRDADSPLFGPPLPDEVRRRVDTALEGARMFGRGGGRGDYDRAGRGGGGPGGAGPLTAPDGSEIRRTEKSPPREGPPGARSPTPGLRGPPDPTRERENQRFIMRTQEPAGYWVATRSLLALPDRRPATAMMVAHVDSLWGLLRFLNLESWILGGAAALGLSIVFWLPLVHGITRSVGQLTRATEEIADGRFETRVPAQRRDEIGKLGESVNRMAARLDAHMTGQKKFLGDVAHELCSPLARLQMASGILAETAPPQLQATVADVQEEVQQMSTLVNELLMFTKAGLQPREAKLADVELAPLVAAVIAREDQVGRVTANVPAEMKVRADADVLARALGNLVRNALRYAGDAGPITVTAAPSGDRIAISVDDEGPGVPSDALDRLGEPFFRPELARTRETGGVGLGLSIVRASVASCGGEVRFANRSPRGFHAEIRLLAA